MNREDYLEYFSREGEPLTPLRDLMRFVNEAVREFEAEELWPWRLTSASGAVPLTVTALGPIDTVVDVATHRPLAPRRRSELVEMSVDLDEAGTARWYYVAGGVIQTYPVADAPIEVHHYSQGGWTTGGEAAASNADTPRADVRWHDTILLLMRLRVLEARGDYQGAGSLWERYQARLEQARQAELRDNYDEPDVQRCSEVY